MQDQLRFTAVRRGEFVAVVCTGWDRTGQPVDFELDAATFRANIARQYDWATRVEAVDDIMRAFIKVGVTPERAWQIAEAGLPAEMHLGTAWRSMPVGQGVAYGGDEIFERLDDVGRQAGDGDH